jgi:hypothetical protein
MVRMLGVKTPAKVPRPAPPVAGWSDSVGVVGCSEVLVIDNPGSGRDHAVRQ